MVTIFAIAVLFQHINMSDQTFHTQNKHFIFTYVQTSPFSSSRYVWQWRHFA